MLGKLSGTNLPQEAKTAVSALAQGKKDALASTLIASLVSRGYTIASQSSAQGSDMHMGNELVFTLIRQPSAADKGQAALDRAQLAEQEEASARAALSEAEARATAEGFQAKGAVLASAHPPAPGGGPGLSSAS